MVGHKAVRKNCDARFSRCSQELRTHEVHDVSIGEASFAAGGAECERVPVETEVAEGAESFGVTRKHE
jgi:hypothetical protein